MTASRVRFDQHRSGPNSAMAKVRLSSTGAATVVLSMPTGYGRYSHHEVSPTTARHIVKVLTAALPDVDHAYGREGGENA